MTDAEVKARGAAFRRSLSCGHMSAEQINNLLFHWHDCGHVTHREAATILHLAICPSGQESEFVYGEAIFV